MSKSRVHNLEGKLVIPEGRLERFEYCVFDNRTACIELHSITEILENIYYNSPKSMVKVEMFIYNGTLKDSVFNVEGELYLDNKSGVYDWMVDNHNLGDVLFNNVDKRISIMIEDIDFSTYNNKY